MAKYQKMLISEYDDDLKGIVNVNNNKITVNKVIVGETIDFDLPNMRENFRLDRYNLVGKSPFRVKPQCSIYEKCGGCSLQHIQYPEQLKIKTAFVKNLFHKQLGNDYQVLPTIGMDSPQHYRNKSQVSFRYLKGKIISGFYEEGTHDLIDYDDCYIQDENCNKIIKTIKELMQKMRLSVYDEDRRTGLIRHVLIKTSRSTKEIMVVIVVGMEMFPGRTNFIKALVARHPHITTIIQNLNNRKTSAVLGDKETVIYGKGYINDFLCGYKFKITSKSFYQINHEQTEKLYSIALKMANFSDNDTIMDAYCGVGTIGIIASKKVKKVIGVEIVKDAIDNAIVNAKQNDTKNISFFVDDATNFMVNMARKKEKLDGLIMDPPRSGSTPEFLKAVLKLMPQKIVYISCNPKTQVVDLKYLLDEYKILSIQPVDLFPFTSHVENVVMLARK